MSFFPIDGRGWKDHCYPPYNHNYGFCLEVHSRFLYTGGETFSFVGDDDVWVYINRILISLFISLSFSYPPLFYPVLISVMVTKVN